MSFESIPPPAFEVPGLRILNSFELYKVPPGAIAVSLCDAGKSTSFESNPIMSIVSPVLALNIPTEPSVLIVNVVLPHSSLSVVTQ